MTEPPYMSRHTHPQGGRLGGELSGCLKKTVIETLSELSARTSHMLSCLASVTGNSIFVLSVNELFTQSGMCFCGG